MTNAAIGTHRVRQQTIRRHHRAKRRAVAELVPRRAREEQREGAADEEEQHRVVRRARHRITAPAATIRSGPEMPTSSISREQRARERVDDTDGADLVVADEEEGLRILRHRDRVRAGIRRHLPQQPVAPAAALELENGPRERRQETRHGDLLHALPLLDVVHPDRRARLLVRAGSALMDERVEAMGRVGGAPGAACRRSASRPAVPRR